MSEVPSRPPLFQRDWPAKTADAPILLIVHGLSEHSGRYEAVAAAAAAEGYGTAAVDLYGHGRSPGKRGHIRSFESDHLGAVDELIRRVERDGPERPLFLLGHSMGGLIAARWAQSRVFARRLRGLVLVSPFVAPKIRVPAWKEALAGVLGTLRPAVTMPTGIPDEAVFREPADRIRFAEDPLVQRRMSAGHWRALTEQRERLVREASQLATPVFLQLAGDDRVVDTEATRALAGDLPDAELREYEKAFHALHHDPETTRVLADMFGWFGERLRA